MVAAIEMAVATLLRLKNDSQVAAVGKHYPFTQSPLRAQSVQHPGHGAGILAALGGFPFEAVDFLDYLDGYEDMIVFEIERGIGVVEEDVGIKNVIFHDWNWRVWSSCHTIALNEDEPPVVCSAGKTGNWPACPKDRNRRSAAARREENRGGQP